MLAVILLAPLLVLVANGLALAISALIFFAQKKPWLGKNNFACFLGICLSTFVWVLLVALIPVGPVGLHNMEGYPALLFKALMLGMTPVSAVPAIMACGPGKK
jgi:hypothetical protein